MTSVASVTSTLERRKPVPASPAADATPSAADPASTLAAPDLEAPRRLGLWANNAWTPAGLAALERLRAAAGPPRTLSAPACHDLASAWADALGLRLERVESTSTSASTPASLPSATALAGRPLLRFAGADAWDRRVVLAEGSPAGGGWCLRLAPDLSATLRALLEGGRWPLWLADEQVRVLPLGAAQAEPARDLVATLAAFGLRAACDSEGPLAGRVRKAGQARVPALCLVGRRELAAGRVTLRWREGEEALLTRPALLHALRAAQRWAPPIAGDTPAGPATAQAPTR